MNTNEIVLKWNQKRKGRSSSWFKEKGGDGSNSVFFLSLMIFIYLNSLRVKDFSYGDSPLERYLIWFSYFKYGTCLFNGTSRQQAYSCMWPSTRPILGAKGWTNSRGLVLQYAFVVCLLITVTSIQRKSEKSRRARIMEFQNGAGLEGYRNPETSSPTHGSYPYLALAQS